MKKALLVALFAAVSVVNANDVVEATEAVVANVEQTAEEAAKLVVAQAQEAADKVNTVAAEVVA